MHDVGPDELRDLGSKYNIAIRETEADDLANRVNDILVGVEEVFDVPLAESDPDRPPATDDPHSPPRHHERGTDPYNAIVTACDIHKPDATGPLAGLELGLKDNIAVAGIPLTCGSSIMRGFVPRTDAPIVTRLLDAGATIAAKTNLDEFASGGPWGESSSERGQIRNPHDEAHVAGGSSGGSAAAVAGGLVDAALGSDTGGSIRIPAAFCGVVGLKPTNGLVPLTDVAETARTLDTVGPMTTSVADAAAILAAIAGPHPSDPGSVLAARHHDTPPTAYTDAVETPPDPHDLTVGVLAEGFDGGLQPGVEDRTRATIDALDDAGATVRDVSIEGFDRGKAIKNVIRYVEGLSYLRDRGLLIRTRAGGDETLQAALGARIDSMSHAFSPTFKAKVLAGAELLERENGVPYRRAQAARQALRERFDAVLGGVDCVLTPTMPAVAPRVDSIDDTYGKAMSEEGTLGFDFAHTLRAVNATGHPAITLPSGSVDGLPTGVQLIGRRFGEPDLLGAASAVEVVVEE